MCNCNNNCGQRGPKGDKGEPGIQGTPASNTFNLTGPVTSVGLATAIADGTITNAMLAKLVIKTPTFATNNYTLILTDDGKELELSNGGTAGTLTIPPNSSVAFAIGTQIIFSQEGTGTITFTAGAGVTIKSAGSLVAFNGQYAGATLLKVAINTWKLFGNLT